MSDEPVDGAVEGRRLRLRVCIVCGERFARTHREDLSTLTARTCGDCIDAMAKGETALIERNRLAPWRQD